MQKRLMRLLQRRKKERFKGGKSDTKVLFNIPYMTNTTALQRGQGVRAGEEANPIQSADDM